MSEGDEFGRFLCYMALLLGAVSGVLAAIVILAGG